MEHKKGKIWQFIGIVDSYGAVHLKPVREKDKTPHHDDLWPCSHKRWRFIVRDWNLDCSILSKEHLTIEDEAAIEAAIRKKITPPRWVLWGDYWEAAGRPRGKKYDKLVEQFEKIHGKIEN